MVQARNAGCPVVAVLVAVGGVATSGAAACGDPAPAPVPFASLQGGGEFTIRADLVGGHPRSEVAKSSFGLDCIVLEPL